MRDASGDLGLAVAWPPPTMSETLNAPWIADYLISIAETYGCKLSNVPVHVKPGKKVQLLQASREQQRCIYLCSSALTLIPSVPHFPPIR